MTYQVLLTRQAEKSFRTLTKADQSRIRTALAAMQHELLAGDVIKLSGHDAYRRRVGTHRVLFTVVEADIVILVLAISRRNERTYKKL